MRERSVKTQMKMSSAFIDSVFMMFWAILRMVQFLRSIYAEWNGKIKMGISKAINLSTVRIVP